MLLGGYLLVYAAMANGGRFATAPWRGLFEDAYQSAKDPSTAPSAAPQPWGGGAVSGDISGAPNINPIRPRMGR